MIISNGEEGVVERQPLNLRVLVCGGRGYTNSTIVYKVLDAVNRRFGISLLIEGGAQGADRASYYWACARGVNSRRFPAKWGDMTVPNCLIKKNKFGREYNAFAGFNRNQQMVDEGKPDICIAFKGERGTDDMVERCHKAGIKVIKVPF